jgi:hypothetical protein
MERVRKKESSGPGGQRAFFSRRLLEIRRSPLKIESKVDRMPCSPAIDH